MVAEYYAQRAAVPGTLLVTEATVISPRAGGYPNVPGIYTQAQIDAWRNVVDAVHAKGSYIYLQLWALGRVSNPEYIKELGHDVVSASDIPADEEHATPRPLSEDEINGFIGDFAQAARNAISAGFDGVEIHGANGYLVDQFAQDTANKRTDQWGGNVENRARFPLETIRAVVDAIGAERTAIRYSPWGRFQGMRMDDPIPQFSYLARKTAEFGLAYVHLVESRIDGSAHVQGTDAEQLDFFLDSYANSTPVLVSGGYTPDSAKEVLDTGKYRNRDGVVVAFGRPFTSNPDLVFRVSKGIALRPYEREYFYVPMDPKGYADYGFSEEFSREMAVLA